MRTSAISKPELVNKREDQKLISQNDTSVTLIK